MTIDEAIKLCDEKVDELEGLITEGYISYVSQTFDCKENADNYKRLAEWLRELKIHREIHEVLLQTLLDCDLDICCDDLMDDAEEKKKCEEDCNNNSMNCWVRWARLKAKERENND